MMYFPTKSGAKEPQNPQKDEDDSLRSALSVCVSSDPRWFFP